MTKKLPPVLRSLFIAVAVLSSWTVIRYVFGDHPRPFAADFYYAYGAAKAWASGLSPYSDAYFSFTQFPAFLELRDPPAPFPYPPNTVGLYWFIGFLSPAGASITLSLLNLVALVVATIFVRLISLRFLPETDVYVVVSVHTVLFCVGWLAGEVIFSGVMLMTTIYAAVLGALYAAVSRKSALLVVCLTITLFKPQIGLPLTLFFLSINGTRAPAALACCATAVLGLTGLLSGGLIQSAVDFLTDVASYGDYEENFPKHVSGVGHIIYRLFGAHVSEFFWLAPTLLLSGLIGRSVQSIAETSDTMCDDTVFLYAVFLVIASAMFFLPSHNNYTVLAIPFVVLAVKAPPYLSASILFALVLHARAHPLGEALADHVGYRAANTATIDTIASTILFGATLALALKKGLASAIIPKTKKLIAA